MTTKTRSDGDGSVYQRNDGKWVASISLGKDHTGKRMRRTRTAETKKQAAAKLRELQNQKYDNSVTIDEKITLAEFCHLWVETMVTSQVDQSTATSYRYALDQWILPHIGHIRLIEFRSENYALCQQKLLDSGLSPATVRHARRPLSACLNQAVRMGILSSNPVSFIRQPRLKGPGAEKAKRLNQTEAQQMLHLVKKEDPMLAGLVFFALERGLRRGEVLGLKWEDIDGDFIHIRRNLREVRVTGTDKSSLSRLEEKPPKTKTSIRDIPLREDLHTILRKIKIKQNKDKLKNGSDWENTGYIFTTDLGQSIWPSNMYIRFKKFLKTHDLPDVSIHDLRRSFAKLSIEGDARLEQVSEALGHASIETTKSIYIGSVPKLAKRAFSAFDDYINPNHHHPLQEIQGNS